MYNSEKCSPIGLKNENSCLSNELLMKITKIINKIDKSKQINVNCSNNELYNQICDRIQKLSKCDNELCWIKIKQIKNKLNNDDKRKFLKSFKPIMPKEWIKKKNKTSNWLSTLDIDNVLENYDKAYSDFKYYGAIPIDFDKKKDNQCLVSDLCKINIQNLLDKDYKKIGIVFNTDPHNKDGEHWFSMYIDLIGINRNKPTIYYFDSANHDINDEILEFVKKIKKQFKKLNTKIEFLYNDIQHQNGESECGIYCIHFITEMLKGCDFETYINKKNSDKEMNQFRNIFYNK